MMTDGKIIELFEFYARDGALPQRIADRHYDVFYDLISAGDEGPGVRREVINHAAWMAREAKGFIKEAQEIESLPLSALETERIDARYKARSKREKAHRWLGFIQSTLWLCGIYSLDELKEHSRKCSDEPEKVETK